MAFPYSEVVLSQKDSSPIKYLFLTSSKFSGFAETTVFNLKAKFTVENAKTGGGLVHIRSANNKYWVRPAPSENVISTADEPNEDQSSPGCTLFRVVMQGSNTFRLVHVQTGREVRRYTDGSIANTLTMDATKARVEFNIIDYRSLVKLPKRVAFRGDNGQLLGRYQYNPSSPHFHQFTKSNLSDTLTMYEIVPARNGDIRVKARDLSRAWKLGDKNWIWSNSHFSESNESDPNFMFQVVMVGPNVVALRSRGNNRFCKRLDADGRKSCLAAATTTIETYARLEVVEPVIERTINVTNFRLDEARIYNHNIILLATTSIPNGGTQPVEHTFRFSEKIIETTSWSNSQTLTTTATMTMSSGIPKLGLGMELKIESQMSETYTWGYVREEERLVEGSHTFTIPPKSKVILQVLARRGTCDVPYSYSQTDLFYDGTRETSIVEDGLYTGANAYFFDYKTDEEPLSALELAQLNAEETVPSLDLTPQLDSAAEEPVPVLDVPQPTVEETKP